jgi:hypothetical protein
LRAFYANTHQQTRYVQVTTDHYAINGIFSVPRLDQEFQYITSYIRTWRYHFIGTGDKYVIYYHDPAPHVINVPMEMIVFRYKKGDNPKRLINLQSSDDWFVKYCIARCEIILTFYNCNLTIDQFLHLP